MARPAERVVPWFEYRNIFLTEERIAAGVRFWTEHAETLEQVAERYGVAPEMIVSIVGIETYFGTRMGRYRVLDALATLAFAYPPRAVVLRVGARVVPAAHAGGGSRPARRRSARTRARWAPASSFRRAIARTPSTPTPTAGGICGATGTTCSAASRTTSASTAGEPASPSWSRRRGPSASRGRSRATASISTAPSAR